MADEGRVVEKTWGSEEWITNTPEYCGKFLYITPGHVCSIHRHPVKTETFHVLAGEGVIGLDQALIRVEAGNAVHIPARTYHFFASLTGMTLLELSTHHDDDDCQRANNSHKMAWGRDDAVLVKLGLERYQELPT